MPIGFPQIVRRVTGDISDNARVALSFFHQDIAITNSVTHTVDISCTEAYGEGRSIRFMRGLSHVATIQRIALSAHHPGGI